MFDRIKAGLLLLKLSRRLEQEAKVAGAKAVAFGLASAIGMAVLTALAAECPGLITNWKSILYTAVVAGVGKWLHSGRSS